MQRPAQLCGIICSFLLLASVVSAQAPTGQVSGTVFDETGAIVPGASLVLTNKGTGASREITSSPQGVFTFPSLISGDYELRATASGFRTIIQPVTVETGSVTTIDVHLQVGQPKEVVTVEAATPQLDYDKHTVDGVVTRQQIDSLPLNGRSFLQLAQLQPGVSVNPASTGEYNKQFDISVLGSSSNNTRITVDGATINDSITGGTQQNFSQDVIQEFQLSLANYDLSTGVGGSGAVNIVTRGGGNEFHGAGFFYYRDHNMGAYPYLKRDPHNPNPYFARKDPGLYFSGPILKDKLFTFTSYEYNNTQAAVSTYPTDPLFAAFASYATSPYRSHQFTERLDYRFSDKHTMFLRYSHDGNNTYSPSGGGTQPSNWGVNHNYADSGVYSLISALSPTKTNEFRFSMTYWSNTKNPPTASVCPAPCFGLGGAQFQIDGIGNFQIGNDASNTPQSRLDRRYITDDNFTWQHGGHSIKFGGEWTFEKATGTYAYADPGGVVLFSPEEVGQYNALLAQNGLSAYAIKIPTSYNSLQDVLQLPVAGFELGIGDPGQPPTYNRGNADHTHRFHFYAQDNWKVTPKFTMVYGLAWSYESNLLNYDLTKPAYLAPIVGANNLGYPMHQTNNWSPMLGFAWNVGNDNKTVVRGGGGIYYDSMDLEVRLLERAALGPAGTARALLPDSVFLSGLDQVFGISKAIPPVPGFELTSLSNFPTIFTGNDFNLILPLMQQQAIQLLGVNPNNKDLTVRNINLFKTAPGQDISMRDFRPSYSQQLSIGVQRQLTNDISVSADFVYQHALRLLIRNTDQNHWVSVTGPVIPACVGAQQFEPLAQCSSGPIEVNVSGGRSSYKGLLLKVNKRFSRNFSFLAAYSLQSLDGLNGINDNYNWFSTWGPKMGRQNLTLSGMYQLPWGFEVSSITTFGTRGGFEPSISGIDINGHGASSLPLPGAGYNEFGLTLGRSDLTRLVQAFNQKYAGTVTPRNQRIPTITLPSDFDFGRNGFSMDFRVSKNFNVWERLKIKIFGEVFNTLNYANRGGYDSNLRSSTFGQPTNLPSQVLGSGGPRIFQVGGRVEF